LLVCTFNRVSAASKQFTCNTIVPLGRGADNGRTFPLTGRETKFSVQDIKILYLLLEHVTAETKSRLRAIPGIVAGIEGKISSRTIVID
jgi:hypothetical protein